MAVSLAFPGPAQAERDLLVEGGKLCTQQFPVQEQKNSIPTHLLAAISTTESGRWHKGLGMAIPWPWTINVDGKGYYFNNKAEAIAQTQKLLAEGHRSIDVGCMQVNLKHHSHAFANLEEAFDPVTNVAYAAKFLHDNYADLGDWIKATAAYHSRTQVYGQQYLVQIERSWNQIVAKVAAARANPGALAANETAANDAQAAVTTPTPRAKPTQPIATTHHVRVVEVSDASHPKTGDVLVIHGASATPPAVAVVASVAEDTPPAPVGDSVRRVTLDNSAAAPQRSVASTPFVFTN